MGWTDIVERVAAVSKYDASVRLYQRKADSKPALVIGLRKTIMCGLKWKSSDSFGLALGGDDSAGKVRIIRRKDRAIAAPRQMKTGSLLFDFGHVEQFGQRGTLKAEAVAVIIDADTVEVTIPTFEYEDEAGDDDDEEDDVATEAQAPTKPASLPAPAIAYPVHSGARGRTPPVTIAGIVIRFDRECEAITFKRKTMEVTAKQAHFIAALARAMPQPVGRDFITKKVFTGSIPPTASLVLDQIAMDLGKALPGIGLQLKNVKGVGFALSEVE
jgi:hypothetical protein